MSTLDSKDLFKDRLEGRVTAKDFEQLLHMAEEVSQNIKEINKTIVNFRFGLVFLFLSIMTILLGFMDDWATSRAYILSDFNKSMFDVLSVTLLFVVIGFMIGLFLRANDKVKEKVAEAKVLKQLLQLIFELRDNVEISMTPVEQAIVDMRLQRVSFEEAA